MRSSVSPLLLLVGMICAVLVFKGKVKLAMTLSLGYFVCVQIFIMLFSDEDPTAPGSGDEQSGNAVARVQAIVPHASEADIRAQLRRTQSIEATIEALSARAAVPVGAPKGRHRTVSFQSKKDSVFDKYRERYLELYSDKVKRNTDLKARGKGVELDRALNQCRRPTGGLH
eukprot:m.53947 g.53947  ORF g.53947 m.53947 type:complete len:171 (-) comp16725_c0_seq1:274-786(-)